MINDPLRLTAEQVTELEPFLFSVRYDGAIHKERWYVDLFVESGQAYLCDSSNRPLHFENEKDATDFCKARWPDAKQMKQSTS